MTLLDDRLITASGFEIARVIESEENGLLRVETYEAYDDDASAYRSLY